MTDAPKLLNDDGTASVATGLLMTHHAFRRDIARFGTALAKVAEGDVSRVDALRAEWAHYRGALHGHHEAEDNGVFPAVRAQRAWLAPVVEKLTAEHRRIDPLLEQADRAFAELPTTHAAREVIAQLSELLRAHLATEEAEVIPFLREAKEFPPPPSPEIAEMYAQGFAWASQGVATEVLARVDAMLGEELRSKLSAARAAFERRSEAVWGPTKARAALTPIPEED
jgi:hemerythrin-like domain-containing protein